MKTNPFIMGCCSCGAAHKAFDYKDHKLFVRMVPDAEWTKVFRTDDVAREPEIFLADSEVKPMRNSRRRFNDDSDFETVYDEFSGEYKKILRDGHSLYVSLEMKDALRRDDQAARDAKIAEAIAVTKAAMQGDGSRENPYVITTSANDTSWLHRPGYRLAADGDDDDPPRRRRKTVERDPSGREKASFEEDAALSPGEIARREWINDTSNAWRGADASQYSSADPQTGMATRAVPASSASGDRWPLSAGEGSVCMSNGRPGKLVKSDDGSSLVCAVEPIKATRADSMTAEEAQPVRDAAYREYVEQMQNAWRG
jgi:hypothetical protein